MVSGPFLFFYFFYAFINVTSYFLTAKDGGSRVFVFVSVVQAKSGLVLYIFFLYVWEWILIFSVRCPGAQVPSRATKHFESKRSFKNSNGLVFSTVWFMIFNSNLLVLKVVFLLVFFFWLHISEHLVGRLFQHQSKVTAGHSETMWFVGRRWCFVFVQYFINIIIITYCVNDLT